MRRITTWLLALMIWTLPALCRAWHDKTHIAIARAAGYEKWYNSAGADNSKIKAGDVEKKNHYVNNPPGTVVTAEMVFDQADRYNNPLDLKGHLYGAIFASIREYHATTQTSKYAEYHLAFCSHYVGDLSQPLHNTLYNSYTQRNQTPIDGIINGEVLYNLALIEVYSIDIQSEKNLAKKVARIANLSLNLGYKLEQEGRMLSRQEAYEQVSHSASLFKGILIWLNIQ